jgi:hypothetical protein
MSTVENNIDKFRCIICNKSYKDKSGLWYHNNKYHNNSINTISHKTPPNATKTSPNATKTSPNVTKTCQITPIEFSKNNNKYECKHCLNIFSRNDSLNRHYMRCKIKNSNQNSKDEIINFLKQTIDEQKKLFEKQMIEMKNQLIETMNKSCKVHPKTLQKINKQLNGDNNIITENNTTNNITYNIIALGHENLIDVFSKKEKMNILKYRFNSLPQLVEYTHFNDKYPQFKNILITNTQNKLAYRYDIKKKQFIAVNKDDLLEDIIDSRMCDINSFYEELEEVLDTKTKEILDKVKDKIDNEPVYKELRKQDIKLIIYNNRKKVTKEVISNLEIEV